MSTDLRSALTDRQKHTLRWLVFKIGGRFDRRALIEQSGLSQSECEHLCHLLEQHGGLRKIPDRTQVTSGQIEILPRIKTLAEQLDSSKQISQTEPERQPPPEVNPAINEPATPISHVVLLVHGIRDLGPWQQNVINALATDGTKIVGCKSGFYSTPRFLCPWDMSAAVVKRVQVEIANAKRAYPNARLSIIAHSFGTHVLTKILLDDTDLRLWRVVFCGSVVEQGFRWDTVANKIGDVNDPDKAKFIVNDCGNADPWPVLGAAAGWRYGNAGTDGFGSVYVTDRFHDGEHGLFFDEPFIVKNWKPFIHEGHIVPGTATQREGVPRYVRFLGLLPLRWFIVIVLFGLAWLAYISVGWTYAKMTAPPISQLPIGAAALDLDPCEEPYRSLLIFPESKLAGFVPQESYPETPEELQKPPGSGQNSCHLRVINETGRPIRIWRYLPNQSGLEVEMSESERPKTPSGSESEVGSSKSDDPQRYKPWRSMWVCQGRSENVPSIGGWAFVYVEDLEWSLREARRGATLDYWFIPSNKGWIYLPYGQESFFVIKQGFFDDPSDRSNFVVRRP